MINYSVINYIFGAPGSGKTTVLAKISRQFLKKGFRVYANFPLKDTILINDEDLGKYAFTDSVLLLDEAGISYNNRDAFGKHGLMKDPQRLQYWKLCRHYLQKNKNGAIFVASQGWNDIDLKIRTLSTNYIYIKRGIIPCFTVLKTIFKKCDIDQMSHEPTDFYQYDIFIFWKLCFRPKYYKYFDSYDAPELPEYPDPVKTQDDIPKVYHLSKILNFDNKDSDPESLSH